MSHTQRAAFPSFLALSRLLLLLLPVSPSTRTHTRASARASLSLALSLRLFSLPTERLLLCCPLPYLLRGRAPRRRCHTHTESPPRACIRGSESSCVEELEGRDVYICICGQCGYVPMCADKSQLVRAAAICDQCHGLSREWATPRRVGAAEVAPRHDSGNYNLPSVVYWRQKVPTLSPNPPPQCVFS